MWNVRGICPQEGNTCLDFRQPRGVIRQFVEGAHDLLTAPTTCLVQDRLISLCLPVCASLYQSLRVALWLSFSGSIPISLLVSFCLFVCLYVCVSVSLVVSSYMSQWRPWCTCICLRVAMHSNHSRLTNSIVSYKCRWEKRWAILTVLTCMPSWSLNSFLILPNYYGCHRRVYKSHWNLLLLSCSDT